MRRKRLTILVAALIAALVSVNVFADKGTTVPIVPDQETGSDGDRIFHTPANFPVHVYYVPSVRAMYFIFNNPMGTLVYSIEELTTGETQVGKLSSESGTAVVPFSGAEGAYRIDLSATNGWEYTGTFSL